MSRFTFRLAGLLRLRESTRDERRAALAEAFRVDDVLRRQMDRLDAEVAGLRDACRRAAGPGTVDLDHLVEAQRYETALRSQREAILRQRETVAAEIERRRQALVEADRDVRVLEKLRERQLEQHTREEARREVKRLDEVAIHQVMREAVR